MELPPHHRLHVLQSVDWKDAVITLLEPRSPYRPWRDWPDEGQKGDTVAFVLNTDPPSILADVAHVDQSGELRRANFSRTLFNPNVVDFYTLMRVLGFGFGSLPYQFDGDDAVKVELSLDECRYAGAPESRFGHNAMAEVRTLLRFSGRCDGCNHVIDLTGEEARDQLSVHTVDPQMQSESPSLGFPDWPAVVCRECRDRMADEGHATFVDYKFSLNPSCPQCHGRRTSEIFYGMPSDYPNIPPWEQAGGCCEMSENWQCRLCHTGW